MFSLDALKKENLEEISNTLTEVAKELKSKNDDRYKHVAKASGIIQMLNVLISAGKNIAGIVKTFKKE